MGLNYKPECDGCPKVERNNIAYDKATISSELDLVNAIQQETDRITGMCMLGSTFDANRQEFVCRTGEFALAGTDDVVIEIE